MSARTTFRLRCGLEVADNVALAPLTNVQSHDDGTLGDDELRWLVRRAQGGFAWVSTCAAYVSAEGKAWRGQLGIADDSHLPGLRRLATALHDAGATAVVQLHHAGPMAALAPGRPLGTIDRPGGTRAADEDDLSMVVSDMVRAALRAQKAGFDGVEIHGANGYLFTHFLSPVENPRTDAYGAGLEGRARLLRQTVRAVRSSVKRGFAVGVRLSPVETFGHRGLLLSDSVQVGRWLADDGVDFVHLSLRDAAGTAPEDPEGPPVARAFRDALPADVPLLAAGDIWTRDDLARAQAAGVDVGVLGRVAIPHPDWPRRSLEPGWAPVRPPFPRDLLTEAAVGEGLMGYLAVRPGMLEGGAPAR